MNSYEKNIINATFKMDKNLEIVDGSREFLRFFDLVSAKGNFKEYLDDYDDKKIEEFFNEFRNDNKTKSIAVTIDIHGENILCLLSIIDYSDDIFNVQIDNVKFANELMSDVKADTIEYEILLSSFDYEFFSYSYKNDEMCLKNTKNLQPISITSLDSFQFFLENRFDVNLNSDFTKDALERLEADIHSKAGGKKYSLLLKNKRYIILSGFYIPNDDLDDRYLVTVNMANSIKESYSSYKETHDGLTGLYNKETISDLAKQRINVMKTECSIIILDVDKFKEYNDSFGHQYGDLVLANVSKAIKNAVTQYGEAGRIGGDEFMCVINTSDEEIVRNVCRNIRLGIQWALPIENPDWVITCSMGIARYPINGDSFDELFNIADKCLYIAKNKGRNCYIIYRPNIHDKIFIDTESRNDAMISGKYFFDNYKMEKKILDLALNKSTANLALNLMLDYLNVSQITLYDKFKIAKAKIGGTKNIRDKAINDPDYFKYLNDYDYFLADNVNVLDTIDKERFNLYNENNIGSTLEIALRINNKFMGLVTYDVYKPSKTFDKSKLSFILLISRLVLENM